MSPDPLAVVDFGTPEHLTGTFCGTLSAFRRKDRVDIAKSLCPTNYQLTEGGNPMSKETVKKFLAECTQRKQYDLAKSIEVGPTAWLLGSPAPSADGGMVALATTPTQTIYFRANDILDAHETEGLFLINVAADSNLLVREEQVVRLNLASCQCQEPEKIQSRIGGTGSKFGGSIVIDCTPICSYETVCEPYKHPGTGAVIVVCRLKFVCRDPCKTILV